MQFPYLLFVYGSLKRGENDYPYWLADPEEAIFISDAMTTEPHPLYVTLLPHYNICEPCLEDITSNIGNVYDVGMQLNVEHKNAVIDEEEIREGSELQKERCNVTCQKCVNWSKRPQCVHGELFAITPKMKAWLDIFYNTYTPEREVASDVQTRTENGDNNNNDYGCHEHKNGKDNNHSSQLKWTCGEINVQLFLSKKRAKRLASVTSVVLDKEIKAITYFVQRECRHKDISLACTCHDASKDNTCNYMRDYINCFSAARCLERYGARFNHGKPRHLLYDSRTKQRVSHLFISLPHELQPKACTTWQFRETNFINKNLIKQNDREQSSQEILVDNTNKCDSEIEFRVDCARSVDGCKSYVVTPITPAPIVLFIIDGVGDNTYVELGNRTPLEVVANVPPRWHETSNGISELSSHNALSETEDTLNMREILNKICVNFTERNEETRTLSDRRKYAHLCQCLERFVEEGINIITRHGVSGLMDPYMAGMSCGSDTAHLSMFGYPPLQYYRGRGAYEALGAGLLLDDDDVAFKSNFATLEESSEADMNLSGNQIAPLLTRRVLHRRCDRDFTREGPILCRDLNNTIIDVDEDGVPFAFAHRIKIQYATEHRCGVAISGPCTKIINSESKVNNNSNNNIGKINAKTMEEVHESGNAMGVLSDKITGTDPLKDNRELIWCAPIVDKHHPEYIAAMYTSRLVNAASAKLTSLLINHPINIERREYNKQIDNIMHGKLVKEEKCTQQNANSDEDISSSKNNLVNNNNNDSDNIHKTSDNNSAISCVALCTSQSLPMQIEQTEKLSNIALQGKSNLLCEKKNLANVILFRGAAKKGWVPSFATRHGLIGAIIAPTCIIKGLGLCCGLSNKIFTQKSTTEEKHETQQNRATAAARTSTTRRTTKTGNYVTESLNQVTSDNELNYGEKKKEHQNHYQKEQEYQRTEEMLQHQEHEKVNEHEWQDEFEVCTMHGATGDVHSDLMIKVKAALCAIYGPCFNLENNEECQDAKSSVPKERFPLQNNTSAEESELICHNQSAYNFVVIHVKGVDDAGHDKSLYDKLNMLNKCGKAMKRLWDALPDNATMGVVADHSTPLWIGDHCCEPVPISIATKRRNKSLIKGVNEYTLRNIMTNNDTKICGIQNTKDDAPTCKHEPFINDRQQVFPLKDEQVIHDNVQYYSEIEARRGALGRFRGEELIDVMKKLHYHYHYH